MLAESMTILGDLCLAGYGVQSRVLQDVNSWKPLKCFAENTFLIANLESPISNCGEPLPCKYATLRAATECLDALTGLDLAVLANNHIADFGHHAALQTIRLLEQNGISHTGYGENLSAAERTFSCRINDVDVHVLNASCPTTNGENLATHTAPGVAPMSIASLKSRLLEKVDECAIRIVYLHWGLENQHRVVREQVSIARAAIDWGADLVVGCHGHVIQPYEMYRGKWIFYGLGNFLFDAVTVRIPNGDGTFHESQLKQSKPNQESLALRFSVRQEQRKATLQLTDISPVSFGEDLEPRPVPEKELTISLSKLNCDHASVHGESAKIEVPDEPFFASQFRNGILAHYYLSEQHRKPVQQKVATPPPSLWRRLRSRVRRFLLG
jgi:poly-gamma-glutamate capsule biosynthesis protein CapA/YwtB (metallophosphatase superfamily)